MAACECWCSGCSPLLEVSQQMLWKDLRNLLRSSIAPNLRSFRVSAAGCHLDCHNLSATLVAIGDNMMATFSHCP